MGYDWKPVEHKLPLAVRYERKSSVRMGWIPVTVNENMEVIPVDYHGSAHITSLAYSDGLIVINAGIKSLEKGDIVSMRLI